MIIGAAWKKVSKNGTGYYSCTIELDKVGNMNKIHVAMFKNKEKKNEKSPDFQIVWNPDYGKEDEQKKPIENEPEDLF
jgi:uncharacterized protein (DUF736 family)